MTSPPLPCRSFQFSQLSLFLLYRLSHLRLLCTLPLGSPGPAPVLLFALLTNPQRLGVAGPLRVLGGAGLLLVLRMAGPFFILCVAGPLSALGVAGPLSVSRLGCPSRGLCRAASRHVLRSGSGPAFLWASKIERISRACHFLNILCSFDLS